MADEEEEEVVDVRPAVVEKCKAEAHNAKLFKEYIKCSERIAKKGHGECTGQYFDFWKSMDKCVRPLSLFLFLFSSPVQLVRRHLTRARAHTDWTRGVQTFKVNSKNKRNIER